MNDAIDFTLFDEPAEVPDTPPRTADIIDLRSFLQAGLALDDDDDIARRPEQDTSWQDDGLCAQADPEAFFPEKGGSTKQAKSICKRCPVTDECLQYALDNDERFGIWGGLSERERRNLQNSAASGDDAAVGLGRVG